MTLAIGERVSGIGSAIFFAFFLKIINALSLANQKAVVMCYRLYLFETLQLVKSLNRTLKVLLQQTIIELVN